MTSRRSLRVQIRSGLMGVAGIKLAKLILGILTAIVLARLLGPESYGLYVFAISLVAILGLPSEAGLPTLLVREIAKNSQGKNWEYMKGILIASNSFILAYSISIIILAYILAKNFLPNEAKIDRESLLWITLIIPVMGLSFARAATLRGLGRVVVGSFPEQIIVPAGVLIIGVTIWFLLDGIVTSKEIIQAHLASASISFVFGWVILKSSLPKEVMASKARYKLREWISSLGPMSLFSGIKVIDAQVAIVLLGLFLVGASEIALYKVAISGAAIVSFGLMVINSVMSPYVARLYYSGDRVKLQRIIMLSALLSTATSIPIAAIYFAFGKDIISLVFGTEYVGAVPLLYIMAFGQVFNSCCGSVAVVLNMCGHEKATVKAILLAFSLNVLMSIVLIPRFGALGAAFAASASLIVWNLILVYETKARTGFDTTIFQIPMRFVGRKL